MGERLEPRTKSQLDVALKELLLSAARNDIDIEGDRWVIRDDDPEVQNVEVETVAIANSVES